MGFGPVLEDAVTSMIITSSKRRDLLKRGFMKSEGRVLGNQPWACGSLRLYPESRDTS